MRPIRTESQCGADFRGESRFLKYLGPERVSANDVSTRGSSDLCRWTNLYAMSGLAQGDCGAETTYSCSDYDDLERHDVQGSKESRVSRCKEQS